MKLKTDVCLKSLIAFTKEFWDLIEPGRPFVDGWHIRAIAEHLEAVARYEIEVLVINLPPRHMKSILVSVMFPAWIWANFPERRFICASYAQNLSSRDALKMRTIIESDKFRMMFSIDWALADDQNQKLRFMNTKQGFRFSTSVGGMLTGEGGDHIMVDDPQNVIDIVSEAYRITTNSWWDDALSTRDNDPNRRSRIVVMQRLHENDLTGHLLAKKDKSFEFLILPARFEENKQRTISSLGWKDPRSVTGELLWPERFTDKALTAIEADMSDSSGQMQQDPKPAGGGFIPVEQWKSYTSPPSDIIEVVQFWDCAQKPGISNDYSVCATWARTPTGFYLLDLYREKTTAPILEAAALSCYYTHRPNAVVIEDKSAGQSLIQTLRAETTIPVIAYEPGQKSKEVRATAATPTIKSGRCYLPKDAPWLKIFLDEHEKFPLANNDDTVDTTSMMVDRFVKMIKPDYRVRSLD